MYINKYYVFFNFMYICSYMGIYVKLCCFCCFVGIRAFACCFGCCWIVVLLLNSTVFVLFAHSI